MSDVRRYAVPRENGSALIAALFLIVVVAALGAFAVRLGSDQQQTANLQLQQYRATAAANAGLEIWAYRASTASAAGLACLAAPAPTIVAVVGDFNVSVSCVRFGTGGAAIVYNVTAEATTRTAAFGSPDFVRRTQTLQMSTFPAPGIWSAT